MFFVLKYDTRTYSKYINYRSVSHNILMQIKTHSRVKSFFNKLYTYCNLKQCMKINKSEIIHEMMTNDNNILFKWQKLATRHFTSGSLLIN